MPVEIVIADPDAHAGLFFAIITERYAAQNPFFPESTVMVVHEQQAGRGIAGDVNVRPAVFVEDPPQSRSCHSTA